MRKFYWEWFNRSLSGAWGILGVFSTITGIFLAAIADVRPQWASPILIDKLNSLGGWKVPMILFSSVFVIRLVLTPYWIYKEQRDKIQALEGRSMSKILVTCGSAVDKSVITAKGITFFRARLELDGPESIRNIKGHITDIRMDGEKMQLNEEAQLRLHPGYPELEELREGVAGFLDVVQVEKDGRAALSLAFNYASVNPWSFFKNGHEYQISVSITGSMKTQAHTFIFNWTGDRQTADVQMGSNSNS